MQGFMGKTATHFFAWLSQRLRLQEPLVIQENVAAFGTEVLQKAAGHIYDIQCVILDPYQLGWPVGRVRKYTVMKHRIKAGYMRQPLTIFTQMFMRPPAPAFDEGTPLWDMFLVAGPRELQEELCWASQRPQSSWQEPEDSSDTGLNPLDVSSFYSVLTATEQTFLATYQQKARSQVYQLNQNPDVCGTISEMGRMFTIIKNAGLLWCLGGSSTSTVSCVQSGLMFAHGACVHSMQHMSPVKFQVGLSSPMADQQRSSLVPGVPDSKIVQWWCCAVFLCT